MRDTKNRKARKEECPTLLRSVREQSRESRRRGELNDCYWCEKQEGGWRRKWEQSAASLRRQRAGAYLVQRI